MSGLKPGDITTIILTHLHYHPHPCCRCFIHCINCNLTHIGDMLRSALCHLLMEVTVYLHCTPLTNPDHTLGTRGVRGLDPPRGGEVRVETS